MSRDNMCECGCGTVIPTLDKRGRPQRFVHGHNGRLRTKPTCAVVTCNRYVQTRGLCGRHWMRIKMYGRLYPVTPKINPELWFWSHVALPTEVDGCWLWTGPLFPAGYGEAVSVRLSPTRTKQAHRWVYEQRVGAIPPNAHIDHLCRVPRCVNPEHLEAVTPAENTRRGLHGVLRTYCKFGHELTPENTYNKAQDGSRRCRQCQAEQMRRKRAALRAEISLGGAGEAP